MTVGGYEVIFFPLLFSITSSTSTTFFHSNLLPSLSLSLFSLQERIIERLKEQREREEREKGEEVETIKKELKELREKVSQLQAELADREVEDTLRNLKTHVHICAKSKKKHILSPSSLCSCQENVIDLSL